MATDPQNAGPIVFVNPAVLLHSLDGVVVNGDLVFGVLNAPPQVNGSAERLNELFRTVGAAIVITSWAGLGDVPWRLRRIGLRACYAQDWFTDPTLDTATGIAAWLAMQGNPPAVIVDRPGVAPAVPVRIDVPVGAEVDQTATRAAAVALAALVALAP